MYTKIDFSENALITWIAQKNIKTDAEMHQVTRWSLGFILENNDQRTNCNIFLEALELI